MTKKNKVHQRRKMSKKQKIIIWIVSILMFMILGYCTAVFSNIPFIKKWRDIYIETAMTTGKHQWLATAFIPGYIIDDVTKFVQREIRRGNKYDAIIMDPPSYGRGKNGEVWQFENNISDLVELCREVLSDDPLFFLINSYTTGLSMTVLENVLSLTVNKKVQGHISSDELGIPMKDSELILPCGIYARWEKEKDIN